MSWRDTHGRRPKTGDRPLKVKRRNGEESRYEYTASQLRFSETGHDYDVVAVRRVDAEKRDTAWTPTSGGY